MRKSFIALLLFLNTIAFGQKATFEIKYSEQLAVLRSRTEYDSEITANSIEKMQQTPLTKVIIISKNNAEKIKLLKSKFKELKNWKVNPDKEFTEKILLEDKSQLLVVNQKKSSTETLLKSFK